MLKIQLEEKIEKETMSSDFRTKTKQWDKKTVRNLSTTEGGVPSV